LATLLALNLALAGCASPLKRFRKTSPAPAPASASPTYVAPALAPLGRVLSIDPVNGTAVVELSPFASIPADLAARALLARDPGSLTPTANLVASGRRSGAILGVYVIDGAPDANDEVVLKPSSIP
jgi:hypothetical protein